MERRNGRLSMARQCQLLCVSRSSVYYRRKPMLQSNLELMAAMDRQHLATPYFGSRRTQAWFQNQEQHINRKRVRRLMHLMGLEAIYQRPRTTTSSPAAPKYPYLLRGLNITKPDQVWAADITYIPMARGFLYLVVIMDWHSWCVLAWRLSNTLDSAFCVDALEEALSKGTPGIFNTDQGSQFTSEAFTSVLKRHGVRISMDGKGRYRDNIFVERLWRSLKYEEVYLKAYQYGREARTGIGEYFRFYNNLRPHQALGYRTPAEVFASRPVEATNEGMVESLTPTLDTLRTAGHDLNKAPVLS